jgi:hypothetical protein
MKEYRVKAEKSVELCHWHQMGLVIDYLRILLMLFFSYRSFLLYFYFTSTLLLLYFYFTSTLLLLYFYLISHVTYFFTRVEKISNEYQSRT